MRTASMFRGSLPNLATLLVSTGVKQALLNHPVSARCCREPGTLSLHEGSKSGRIHSPCAPKYPCPPPTLLRVENRKVWYADMGTPLQKLVMPLTRHPPMIALATPQPYALKRL